MNIFSGVLFVCVLINVQNMKTKFLLVELAEGPRIPGIPSNSFRAKDGYPIKVEMPDRYYETCASEELKKAKVYYVQKCKIEHNPFDWAFRAYLKKGICGRKKFLSELNAKDGGYCYATINLSPKPVQGCGLATKMMELCFSDTGVGSLDPAKDYNFKLKGLEKWRDMAILNCEHIIFTTCNPAKPTPTAGCAAYMTAAINTGHTIMFSFPTGKGEMDVMNVADEAKPQLKKDADTFVSNHGNQWSFCRCKDDRVNECNAM